MSDGLSFDVAIRLYEAKLAELERLHGESAFDEQRWEVLRSRVQKLVRGMATFRERHLRTVQELNQHKERHQFLDDHVQELETQLHDSKRENEALADELVRRVQRIRDRRERREGRAERPRQRDTPPPREAENESLDDILEDERRNERVTDTEARLLRLCARQHVAIAQLEARLEDASARVASQQVPPMERKRQEDDHNDDDDGGGGGGNSSVVERLRHELELKDHKIKLLQETAMRVVEMEVESNVRSAMQMQKLQLDNAREEAERARDMQRNTQSLLEASNAKCATLLKQCEQRQQERPKAMRLTVSQHKTDKDGTTSSRSSSDDDDGADDDAHAPTVGHAERVSAFLGAEDEDVHVPVSPKSPRTSTTSADRAFFAQPMNKQ